MTDILKILDETIESLRPLYECRDRLRACLITMGENAYLCRREDGSLDFFGTPATAMKFALYGSELQKAKKMLVQLRRDNPASTFSLTRLDIAVEKSFKSTQDMIERMKLVVQA